MKIHAILILILFTCIPSAFAADGNISPPESGKGIIVQKNDGSPLHFIPWVSEHTVNKAIISLRKPGGGVIFFTPGTYVIRQGITIPKVNNISLIGGQRVRLVFPSLPKRFPALVKEARKGDPALFMDDTSSFVEGSYYQLYTIGKKEVRVLEFYTKKIEKDRIILRKPVYFMQHVKSIPVGSIALERLNFFNLGNSSEILIQGFEMDGLGRGPVEGHTLYSGILSRNRYNPESKEKSSSVNGIYVINNTFKNLQGRAAAFYGASGVLFESNTLTNITAEGVEIDHFSSGRVIGNNIYNARSAIVLNDAYKTQVQRNIVENSVCGVSFTSHYDKPWVNTDNIVSNNIFSGIKAGGVCINKEAHDNNVSNNITFGNAEPVRDQSGKNRVFNNKSLKPGNVR